MCCGRSWASPRITATSSTRRGRSWIEAALAQDEIEVVVQVNGKLRGRVTVPANADETMRAMPRWPMRTCRSSSTDKSAAQSDLRAEKLVNLVV